MYQQVKAEQSLQPSPPSQPSFEFEFAQGEPNQIPSVVSRTACVNVAVLYHHLQMSHVDELCVEAHMVVSFLAAVRAVCPLSLTRRSLC